MNGWRRLFVLLACLWLPICVFVAIESPYVPPAKENIRFSDIEPYYKEPTPASNPNPAHAQEYDPRRDGILILNENATILPLQSGNVITLPGGQRIYAPLQAQRQNLQAALSAFRQTENLKHAAAERHAYVRSFYIFLLMFFIPTVVVYILGAMVVWVIRGFRNPSPRRH